MRNPYKGFSEPCRDHERVWNGICVDIGLEDEWLVALNSLDSFFLTSICVGHKDLYAPIDHFPDIVILYDRRKEKVSSSGEIAAMITRMQTHTREVFPKHYFSLTMLLGVRISTVEKGIIEGNMIGLYITVSDQFKPGISSKKHEWFEMVVQKIVEFDQIWTKEEEK